MVPGLSRYFVTDRHDDMAGITRSYGGLPVMSAGIVANTFHGLSTTGAAIGLVVSLVAAAIVGLVLVQLGLGMGVVLIGGLIGFTVAMLLGGSRSPS